MEKLKYTLRSIALENNLKGIKHSYEFFLLNEEFKKFAKIPSESYSDSIKEYMKSQSIDKLKSVLKNVCNSFSS